MSGITMSVAVHEAAHAVVAINAGGFAEFISLHPSDGRRAGCWISWPLDGDWTNGRLLSLAAGPAATAIFTRRGQAEAIFSTGVADCRRMRELGGDEDDWFKIARAECRKSWPAILRVAEAAIAAGGYLCEERIAEAVAAHREPHHDAA